VANFLDEQGVAAPHLAGNSLGGWVALELADIHPVASLALLSPAGLWRKGSPLYDRVSLRAIRWFAKHAGAPLSHVVGSRLGRRLVLQQTHGRPARISPDYARTALRDMGTCAAFEATMRASEVRRYERLPIDAPVTVAFGSRDFILLPWQSRHIERLPPGTHVGSLPRCGHVPMADDPPAVVALVAAATARALTERP
jgi:pimeloyl-ACP methyl ester carboxylesterase